MQYAFATLLTLVAAAAAQTTSGGACASTVSGKFLLTPLNVTLSQNQARSIEERDAICKKPTVTLQNGVLTDQSGATGEIVANNQLQFDHILQPGRLYDTGFCIYPNRSLAIGGSAIFYSCISGDFSNLYNKDIGSVCSQVYLSATVCTGGEAAGSNTASVGVSGTTSSSSSSTSSSTTSSTTSISTKPTPKTSAAALPPPPPPPSTHPTPETSTTPPPPPPPPATTAAPYPVGNTTSPAPSGSAPGTTSATTSTSTTAGTSSTSPAAFEPSSGANVLAIGSQLIAGIAAVGAFAMF